jgi:hypothetical protein
MYDVHADPACFSRVQPSTVGTPRYGLYLGEAHDWIALYDPEKRTTTRRSQRELTVRLLPSEDWPEATDDLAGRC